MKLLKIKIYCDSFRMQIIVEDLRMKMGLAETGRLFVFHLWLAGERYRKISDAKGLEMTKDLEMFYNINSIHPASVLSRQPINESHVNGWFRLISSP